MYQDKAAFLKNEFLLLLASLQPDSTPQWGLMNGQQMIEHFVDVVRNANGRLKLPALTEGVELEKMRAFLFSEKPFAKNIRNPYIAEQPPPVKQPNIQGALQKLEKELIIFFEFFGNNPLQTTTNPFFGELDYSGNVQLLYKHALHHLRQFGLVNE